MDVGEEADFVAIGRTGTGGPSSPADYQEALRNLRKHTDPPCEVGRPSNGKGKAPES